MNQGCTLCRYTRMVIKGNPIYHFKGKGIYNLSFSQNHNRTKIYMLVWLRIGLNMARKWLIWGILLFSHKIYYVTQFSQPKENGPCR